MREERASVILILALLLAACATAPRAQAPFPATPAGVTASTPASAEKSAQPSEGSARTADEQKEELDGRLGASLSAFDAMLLKEQQEAATRRAEQQAKAGGGSGSGGEGEGASAGGGGSPGGGSAAGKTSGGERSGSRERAAGSAEGGEGDRASGSDRGDRSSRTGDRNAAGGRAVESNDGGVQAPPDVGDGRDDDVVARQLREAALAEKDPAIREKLWDEYRRYKGTTR
jgi:hypothetical protein